MLDPKYISNNVEQKIHDQWMDTGAFKAGAGAKVGAESFSIVIPPPNVTGSLHIGHALNNTLQDILVRWHRMRGFDTLWQPGTDHAGIATQMVVERKLAESQQPSRREMGREKFIEKVWEWKEESGGVIINQLKRLGASCDWSRERFTMDPGFHDAVLKVFVDMYNKDQIYRGKRLVNWDPHFETAISDLEVENIEVNGHMWHFKYPLAGGETYTYVEKNEDGNVTLTEERDYIAIATTRPETMLGDGAVAVHPDDERYASIVGKLCEIPVGPKELRRQIPIITDEYPVMDFGSGAVKITGAHDFNDYEVAKRNGIPLYALMDTKGAMRADGLSYHDAATQAQKIAQGEKAPEDATPINLVPEEYRGMDRFEARKKVIADITAEGLAVMHDVTKKDKESGEDITETLPYIENKKIMQPFGDRSKVVIEPMLTDQWYVDTSKIVQPAIDAVKSGEIKLMPESQRKVYFHWLENIEPWCISRQLWWGHQIPVWYGPAKNKSGEVDYSISQKVEFCGASFEEVAEKAKSYYGVAHVFDFDPAWDKTADGYKYLDAFSPIENFHRAQVADYFAGYDDIAVLERDPDVLDTWFSSGLWPIGTLGWPEETDELAKYFPTSVLITGFDIIFFWVARMIMMQKSVVGKIPFHTVYTHALVRDEKGKKMSKSVGNVIDPLVLIEEYGADATRFTFAAMAAPGADLKLSMQRVAGYRNFVTKIWNAARFLEMNECQRVEGFDPKSVQMPLNRWILGSTTRAVAAVTKSLGDFRFNDASSAAYEFVWGTFCDWFIELAKPTFMGEDEAQKAETRATAAFVLDQILALLHPFMPFVTEELWAETGKTGPARENMLVISAWPELAGLESAEAEAELNWLVDVISGIRSVRAQMNVPASARIPLHITGASDLTKGRIATHTGAIERLARIEAISLTDSVPSSSAQIVLNEANFALPLGDVIDIDAEKARLNKDIAKMDKEIMQIAKKLGNEQFLAKAPAAEVEKQRARAIELEGLRERLSEAVSRLD